VWTADASEAGRRLGLVLAVTAAAILTAPGTAAGDIVLHPVADIDLAAGAGKWPPRDAAVLRVRRAPRWRAYLRFRMPRLPGPRAATLAIHVGRGARGRLELRRVTRPRSVSERRARARRAPPTAGPRLRSPRLRGRGWVRIAVTPLLHAGRRVAFAVTSTRTARLASRESRRPPRLTLHVPDTGVFRPGVPAPGPSVPVVPPPALRPPVPPAPVVPPPTPRPPAPAWLTVTQAGAPGSGALSFATTGAGLEAFSLADGEQRRFPLTDTGRRTVTQLERIGWPLVEVACSGDDGARVLRLERTVVLDPDPGEAIHCRFANGRHDPVVAAAGDIACREVAGDPSSCRQRHTSDLLIDRPEIARVLPLGDLQYESGELAEFLAPGAYHDTWGRLLPITRPVPGNHEYQTLDAAGYFDYFNGVDQPVGLAGDRATGYYSFDLGAWHVVALNSNLPMAAGSVQEQWLRADLAAAGSDCLLAYWHRPRWTSGAVHSPTTSVAAPYRALHEAGADLLLSAHNHQYERFAPQDPAGRLDPIGGIRQFVVGTGGSALDGFDAPQPNSEVRDSTTWGVLEVTLRAGSYTWSFAPAVGEFRDHGAASCDPAPDPPPRYERRGLFSREVDGSFTAIAGLGFNLIDSRPSNVDELTNGLEGMVWVGNYDNATCAFDMSDEELRAHVEALAGDPKVGVWFVSDEPSPECADVYAEHRARTELIKTIDPSAEVLIVVDGNSAQETLNQLPHWKGVADHIGLNPYTCWQGQPCRLEWIDRVAEAADAAGLGYWGVLQAFGEPEGEGFTMCSTTSGCGKPRLPTPEELHEQFERWRATAMSGYLVFEWRWPDHAPEVWLANQPSLQAQLAEENAWTEGN
jgi:hypothetical protein